MKLMVSTRRGRRLLILTGDDVPEPENGNGNGDKPPENSAHGTASGADLTVSQTWVEPVDTTWRRFGFRG
jgi:hypothetical protein